MLISLINVLAVWKGIHVFKLAGALNIDPVCKISLCNLIPNTEPFVCPFIAFCMNRSKGTTVLYNYMYTIMCIEGMTGYD